MSIKKEKCYVKNEDFPIEDLIKGSSIRVQVLGLIHEDFPNFLEKDYISLDVLNDYRKKYLQKLFKEEKKDLGIFEKEIIETIHKHKILSEDIEPDIASSLTLGNRVADKIAEFGGSWAFIIAFFSFIFFWMLINIWLLSTKPFDPYPFILLNLILSCLAAIQAPVIMMSQNRKEQKDRLRSENDYKINLKSEIEIRLLHEKIDHLIYKQNKHFLEMQELQLEYLEEIVDKINKEK